MYIEAWRPWIFLLLCASLFATLIWLVTKKDGKGATFALIGALACAFFSDVNNFELFKFSAQNGLEARVRTVVDEAQSATSGLRQVAVAASAAIVGMTGLPSNGGMAMMQPARLRDQNKSKLIEVLKSMGVPESQLEMVESADRDSVIQQYESSIYFYISGSIQKHGTEDDRNKLKAAAAAGDLESPDKITKFLAGLSFHDQETEDIVKDFSYYTATGKQRRPEVWASRDDWLNGRQ